MRKLMVACVVSFVVFSLNVTNVLAKRNAKVGDVKIKSALFNCYVAQTEIFVFGENFGEEPPAIQLEGLPLGGVVPPYDLDDKPVKLSADLIFEHNDHYIGAISAYIPPGTYRLTVARDGEFDKHRECDTIDVTIGVVGPQGIPGEKGDTGAQGSQGPAGADGKVGPQGIPGEKGDTGAQGSQGPAGADGNLALAGQICSNDSVLIGFDAVGNIVCRDSSGKIYTPYTYNVNDNGPNGGRVYYIDKGLKSGIALKRMQPSVSDLYHTYEQALSQESPMWKLPTRTEAELAIRHYVSVIQAPNDVKFSYIVKPDDFLTNTTGLLCTLQYRVFSCELLDPAVEHMALIINRFTY